MRAGRYGDAFDVHGERNPHARIRSFRHLVVHQPRVAAQRNAAARGSDIRFRVDGVLEIAHAIGGVGQGLGHGDAGVGFMPLGPIRNEDRHSVEDRLFEPVVISRKIMYIGGRRPGSKGNIASAGSRPAWGIRP